MIGFKDVGDSAVRIVVSRLSFAAALVLLPLLLL